MTQTPISWLILSLDVPDARALMHAFTLDTDASDVSIEAVWLRDCIHQLCNIKYGGPGGRATKHCTTLRFCD